MVPPICRCSSDGRGGKRVCFSADGGGKQSFLRVKKTGASHFQAAPVHTRFLCVSFRWHYPNQVIGLRCHLTLSLSHKLPFLFSSFLLYALLRDLSTANSVFVFFGKPSGFSFLIFLFCFGKQEERFLEIRWIFFSAEKDLLQNKGNVFWKSVGFVFLLKKICFKKQGNFCRMSVGFSFLLNEFASKQRVTCRGRATAA